MTGLHRLVRSDQILAYARDKTDGDHCRGRRNETIYHDRDTTAGSSNHYSDQSGNLQSADFMQNIQSIFSIRLVHSQSLLDDLNLAFQTLIIDAGPAPDHLRHGESRHGRNDSRGRRGIADSHIASGNEIKPAG